MASQINKIGRRKTSTARVYLKPGSGSVTINNRTLEEYFPLAVQQNMVNLPFVITETEGKYDAKITVRGGGYNGQAGAIQLGIARALDEILDDAHSALKAQSLFTRDDRMVERKKYGRPKARKRFQFSKR
ncbi:30S ribosomal protein S9 [bacterium]|jgi:small subunit ribosomal protein S9|nr:MAG: 30S ribosomal protein S9 [bacterium]